MNAVLEIEKPRIIAELCPNSPVTLNTPVLGTAITYGQLFMDEATATNYQQPLFADGNALLDVGMAYGHLPVSEEDMRNLPDEQKMILAKGNNALQFIGLVRQSPELTDMNEIRALKAQLAMVSEQKGYIIHAGLCAENIDAPVQEYTRGFHNMITGVRDYARQINKIAKVDKPIVMIGRVAGQFAKPRTEAYEIVNGVRYPSFRGTNINGKALDDRMPSIERMARGNAFAGRALHELHGMGGEDIFASHEYLSFLNEIGYIRVDEMGNAYGASAPLFWLGDRTNDPDGSHVHAASLVENVIGLKIGMMEPKKLDRIVKKINPKNEKGKVLPILRPDLGRASVMIPPLIEVLVDNGIDMGIVDPMHGEGIKKTDPASGKTTRYTKDIERNIQDTMYACLSNRKFHLAGLSLEVSGDKVTECLGLGVTDLHRNNQSLCDPCYNPTQAAIDMGLLVTMHLAAA